MEELAEEWPACVRTSGNWFQRCPVLGADGLVEGLLALRGEHSWPRRRRWGLRLGSRRRTTPSRPGSPASNGLGVGQPGSGDGDCPCHPSARGLGDSVAAASDRVPNPRLGERHAHTWRQLDGLAIAESHLFPSSYQEADRSLRIVLHQTRKPCLADSPQSMGLVQSLSQPTPSPSASKPNGSGGLTGYRTLHVQRSVP
jgi:hypothetical protein